MSRAAALGALLALVPAAVVTAASRPADAPPQGVALGEKIPRVLGPWVGVDEPLDAATLAYLRSDDYVNRTYSAPGERSVELTIVFSRQERKAVHPPEVCLQAQGWELFARDVTPLAVRDVSLDAAALHLAREGKRMDVLSWYVGGGESTPSFARQQWNVAIASLTGAPRGAALVRLVSVTDAASPRGEGTAALGSFAETALPSIAHAFE